MRLHGTDRLTLDDWMRRAAISEDLSIELSLFTVIILKGLRSGD